jgi:membrane-bound lytic murein transglycosylase D
VKEQKWRRSLGLGHDSTATLALGAVLAVAVLAGSSKAVARYHAEAADRLVADEAFAAETVTYASAASDGEGHTGWDLPNLDHPRVDYWVNRFTTDRRQVFERFLRRSGRYAPMISEKLAERDMPQDLIYLAMIESGFVPTAYSHAHASGLWQFISETGRRYGLTVNAVVDERNDPVRSTDAALDYLTYLHNRFGSWYLAAAGYNTGENRVGRIMREVTGSERGDEESYYRIWNRLPRETRDYVPLMIAAARISKDLEKYGFAHVELDAPLAYEEVTAPAGAYLTAVARAAGAELAEVRRLNPQLRNARVPTNRDIAVRLPPGTASSFAANWQSVGQQEQRRLAAAQRPAARPATRAYRVQRGDNLIRIASRHGVTVNSLRSANNLRGDRILAGQTLRIPAR